MKHRIRRRCDEFRSAATCGWAAPKAQHSISSLGRRPRINGWLASALKARVTSKHRIWMNRAFSACLRGNQILGRCPQA